MTMENIVSDIVPGMSWYGGQWSFLRAWHWVVLSPVIVKGRFGEISDSQTLGPVFQNKGGAEICP